MKKEKSTLRDYVDGSEILGGRQRTAAETPPHVVLVIELSWSAFLTLSLYYSHYTGVDGDQIGQYNQHDADRRSHYPRHEWETPHHVPFPATPGIIPVCPYRCVQSRAETGASGGRGSAADNMGAEYGQRWDKWGRAVSSGKGGIEVFGPSRTRG